MRIKEKILTSGELYEVDNLKQKKYKLGIHYVILENQTLIIHTQPKRTFDIQSIKGEVITRKHNFSFDYEDKTYNFLLKDPMLILNTITYIKEN